MNFSKELREELSRELFLEIDTNGHILQVSSSVKNILGHSREKMVHSNINIFIHHNNENSLLNNLKDKDEIEFALIDNKNKIVYMGGQAYIDKNIILLHLIDITKYKEIEEREKSLRNLLDYSQDIIYRFEIYPEKRFSYISKAVEDIMGYSPEDHYKDYTIPMNALIPEDEEKLFKSLREEIPSGAFEEVTFMNKEGKYVTLEKYEYPVYKDNKLIAVEGVSRDITSKKILKDELINFSFHDTTTGLYSKEYIQERLEVLNTIDKPVGVIVCRLDELKNINKQYGHDAGDKYLYETARLMESIVGKSRNIARVGGDKFAVLIEDTNYCEIKYIINSLMGKIKKLNSNRAKSISVAFDFTKTSYNRIEGIYIRTKEKLLMEKSILN